jgi:hypothetical protein
VKKKTLGILFLFFGLSFTPSLEAQGPPAGTPHSVTLTWTAPSPTGGSGTIAGYNMYKATAGGAFVKINTALIPGLTTVDTNVTAGQVDKYCATTVDSASQESVCSNTVTATIPTNPGAPTLSAPLVAMVRQGNQDVLTATWTDGDDVLTSYTIFGKDSVLKIGVLNTSQADATGHYTVTWKGQPQDGFVSVCDRNGACLVTPFHAI